MPSAWYTTVDSEEPLSQGDIVFACPLLTWEGHLDTDGKSAEEELEAKTKTIQADVVVVTQACDLEHRKVSDVVVCPHYDLNDFKAYWEKQRGATLNDKEWRHVCDNIVKGNSYAHLMLESSKETDPAICVRVVAFNYIYTVPRVFLEQLVNNRGQSRLRLLPPYREYLSQAYARFFMRVGLPAPITKSW